VAPNITLPDSINPIALHQGNGKCDQEQQQDKPASRLWQRQHREHDIDDPQYNPADDHISDAYTENIAAPEFFEKRHGESNPGADTDSFNFKNPRMLPAGAICQPGKLNYFNRPR
jgi:hypothetical protein